MASLPHFVGSCMICRSNLELSDGQPIKKKKRFNEKSKICPQCLSNIKKHGSPKMCQFCNLSSAFVGGTCMRCHEGYIRSGPPMTCQECKRKCAFDGKLSCWLCTSTYISIPTTSFRKNETVYQSLANSESKVISSNKVGFVVAIECQYCQKVARIKNDKFGNKNIFSKNDHKSLSKFYEPEDFSNGTVDFRTYKFGQKGSCKTCKQNLSTYGMPTRCIICNVHAAFHGKKCEKCDGSNAQKAKDFDENERKDLELELSLSSHASSSIAVTKAEDSAILKECIKDCIPISEVVRRYKVPKKYVTNLIRFSGHKSQLPFNSIEKDGKETTESEDSYEDENKDENENLDEDLKLTGLQTQPTKAQNFAMLKECMEYRIPYFEVARKNKVPINYIENLMNFAGHNIPIAYSTEQQLNLNGRPATEIYYFDKPQRDNIVNEYKKAGPYSLEFWAKQYNIPENTILHWMENVEPDTKANPTKILVPPNSTFETKSSFESNCN